MIPSLWCLRAMPLDHCGGWSRLTFDSRELVAVYADESGGGPVVQLRTGGRWLVECHHEDGTSCLEHLLDAWQRGVVP